MKCIVLFTNVTSILQAPSVKRPQVIGNSKDGIYYMNGKCFKKTNSVTAFVICSCLSHKNLSFPISSFNEPCTAKSSVFNTTNDHFSSDQVPDAHVCFSSNNTNVLYDVASTK